MRVYSQKNGSDCFVYALANAYSYLGKKQDAHFQRAFKEMREECKNGPYLSKMGGMYKLGIAEYFQKTEHIEDLQMFGGIVALKHPIFNLHAAFVSPVDIERCMVYNSWLGPTEMCITWKELFGFCRHNNCCHWKLMYGQEGYVPHGNLPQV